MKESISLVRYLSNEISKLCYIILLVHISYLGASLEYVNVSKAKFSSTFSGHLFFSSLIDRVDSIKRNESIIGGDPYTSLE